MVTLGLDAENRYVQSFVTMEWLGRRKGEHHSAEVAGESSHEGREVGRRAPAQRPLECRLATVLQRTRDVWMAMLTSDRSGRAAVLVSPRDSSSRDGA